MPELQVYPEGAAFPAHFYYQAQSFIRIFWVDGDDFDIDQALQNTVTRIVVAQGKALISYATIVRRDIEFAGATYACLGLGDVMTFPAFRKQGYGGQVVQTATRLMRDDATADFGLLWTAPHNTAFYVRQGWTPAPDVVTLAGKPDAPEMYDDEPAMLLFLSDRARNNADALHHARLYIGDGKW